MPWAGTPQGLSSQSLVSVPTGTLSGESPGVALPVPTRRVPVCGGGDEDGVRGGATGLWAQPPQFLSQMGGLDGWRGDGGAFPLGRPLFSQSSRALGTSSHCQRATVSGSTSRGDRVQTAAALHSDPHTRPLRVCSSTGTLILISVLLPPMTTTKDSVKAHLLVDDSQISKYSLPAPTVLSSSTETLSPHLPLNC